MLGGALRSESEQAWLRTATATEHKETRNYRPTINNFIHWTSAPLTKTRLHYQDYPVASGFGSQTKQRLLSGNYHHFSCTVTFVVSFLSCVSTIPTHNKFSSWVCFSFLSRPVYSSLYLFRWTTGLLFVPVCLLFPNPCRASILFPPLIPFICLLVSFCHSNLSEYRLTGVKWNYISSHNQRSSNYHCCWRDGIISPSRNLRCSRRHLMNEHKYAVFFALCLVTAGIKFAFN
jgi:hypothetical protein